MTAKDELRMAAERLREATAAGAFPRAERMLLEYRRQLEEVLGNLPAGGAESGELAREATALLEWTRRTVLASRAAAATRLAKLPRPLPGYRPVRSRPHCTFEIRG